MMSNNFINRTKSAAKFTLIFNILTKIIGLLVSVLLVRALSEQDYGIYNLLYSVIALIGMVASFGIGNTLQRYMPEYYEKGEFKIAHNLYRIATFIRLISNVVILGVIALCWNNIAPILKIAEYKTYFLLFTVIIILYMQRGILETCLSSYFLHKYSKAVGLVFPLIKAVGYGYLIIFNKSLWFALITDIIAYTIVFIALQAIYFEKIPVSTGKLQNFTKQEKKRITKYALFYNFNDAGSGLLDANSDNFIIAIFLNPVAVGAYAFSLKITQQINNILPIKYFLDVIRPAFFTVGSSSNKQNSTLFFQSLIKINFIFNIPCLFFLLLFSSDFISVVFNGKFIEYSNTLCGVFFFSVLNSFQIPVGLIAQLKEKADVILYSKIFAVYNLIADIVLIKMFGIWGAIIATGTATLGKNFFIWYFVRQDACIAGLKIFFIKVLIFWTILSIPIYFINLSHRMSSRALARILFGGILFVAAFFIQFRCNYFNTDEKKLYLKISGKKSKLNFILRIFRMIPEQ